MNQNTLWLPGSWWHYKHNFFEFWDWCDEVYEPYQTVLKNHYKEISHEELYQELLKNSAKMFSSIGVLYSYKSIEAVAKILIDVRLRAMLNSANLDEARLKYYDWIHQVVIRSEIGNRFELNLLSREIFRCLVLKRPDYEKDFGIIYKKILEPKVNDTREVKISEKDDLRSHLDEKIVRLMNGFKKEWSNNKEEEIAKLWDNRQIKRLQIALNYGRTDFYREKQKRERVFISVETPETAAGRIIEAEDDFTRIETQISNEKLEKELSRREREIFSLTSKGYRGSEIAKLLDVTKSYVSRGKKNIIKKGQKLYGLKQE